MPSQLDRLEALLTRQEENVRAAFEEFVRNINSEHVLAKIADLLEQGDIDGALEIVETFVARFADVVPRIQHDVGSETAAELNRAIGPVTVGIGFDPTHPRAADLARAARLNLITEFSDEQRAAVRQALSRAFESGAGTAATARAFRNAIGLTTGQEQWVASFENQLRNLDAAALDRALRDRRYDRTINRAIDLRQPLTEAQIGAMVERYRARALIYRSENIARTEALRNTSMAREEALQQMLEQTQMPASRVTRIWNAIHDERTRIFHRTMDQQERPMDEAFSDGHGNSLMWPGDPTAPPETTINCRCAVTFRISPPPA